MVNQTPDTIAPVIVIALIDAKNLSALWDANVLMGEQELPYAWKKCKTMNTAAGGINHDGAGAINEIAGSDLLMSGL